MSPGMRGRYNPGFGYSYDPPFDKTPEGRAELTRRSKVSYALDVAPSELLERDKKRRRG